VVGAVAAGGFTVCSKVLRQAFGRLPATVRPVLGGAALGGLAFLSPYALTFGEGQIQTVSTAKLALATLLLAAVVKLVASSMIVSSGWRGGFIIPMFFVGVALGAAAHQLLGVDLLVAIAASMVAVNVGVTKTPFGSSVVVAEMAGIRLLPPVLLASIVSLFLTSRVSMIDTQRARDGTPALPDPPSADRSAQSRAADGEPRG
jgi:H+/Cl- antiporter ClcA